VNEWKYQMRRRKRGEHCAFWGTNQIDGTLYTVLCGCGNRTPPPKSKKTRIVKRELARQLADEIRQT
jgi:hypothetical protein